LRRCQPFYADNILVASEHLHMLQTAASMLFELPRHIYDPDREHRTRPLDGLANRCLCDSDRFAAVSNRIAA
jgi:hypothetical protein